MTSAARRMSAPAPVTRPEALSNVLPASQFAPAL